MYKFAQIGHTKRNYKVMFIVSIFLYISKKDNKFLITKNREEDKDMRRTDLIGTTMALSLAVFMSAVATGCGKNDIDTDVTQSEVVETMATIETSGVEQTVESATEYEVVKLQVPYVVMIAEDTFLMDSPDTAGKIVDLAKESVVTIVGEVTYGGVTTEFYYGQVGMDTSVVEGYIDGKYIDFNSKVEDSMMGYSEVEGGDGIETTTEVETQTEIVEEEVPTEQTTIEAVVEPYLMYTTQSCNVRESADKSSALIMTLAKGVEVTCFGTEGEWIRIDCQGIYAYIHSSLLSSTKSTESTATSKTTQSVQVETSTQVTQVEQQVPTTPSQIQPYTPVQNADGTITVYDDCGDKLTLTPDGKGGFIDQDGFPRSKEGYNIDPITGQPLIPQTQSTIEVTLGHGYIESNSGIRAE